MRLMNGQMKGFVTLIHIYLNKNKYYGRDKTSYIKLETDMYVLCKVTIKQLLLLSKYR